MALSTIIRQGRAERLIEHLEQRQLVYPFPGKEWHTVRQMARAMGLRPSAYARLIIADLCELNVLEARGGIAPNGSDRFEYAINPRSEWTVK